MEATLQVVHLFPDELEDSVRAIIEDRAIHGGVIDDDDKSDIGDINEYDVEDDLHTCTPSKKAEASAALCDLHQILKPCQKSGKGHINPGFDPLTCNCFQGMKVLLVTYLNNQGSNVTW